MNIKAEVDGIIAKAFAAYVASLEASSGMPLSSELRLVTECAYYTGVAMESATAHASIGELAQWQKKMRTLMETDSGGA